MSCGDELPIAVSVLKCFLMDVLHNVHIELSAEDQVVVHSLCSDLSNFTLSKFKESITLGPGSLHRPRNAQFCDLAELLEEILKLSLIEALGQMAYIQNATAIPWGHLELVESAGQTSLAHLA